MSTVGEDASDDGVEDDDGDDGGDDNDNDGNNDNNKDGNDSDKTPQASPVVSAPSQRHRAQRRNPDMVQTQITHASGTPLNGSNTDHSPEFSGSGLLRLSKS